MKPIAQKQDEDNLQQHLYACSMGKKERNNISDIIYPVSLDSIILCFYFVLT